MTTEEPVWIVEAKKHLGQHEGTNENPNPNVLRMFAEIGHPEVENDHKTAWCAVFIACMMKRCNIPLTEEACSMWATDLATYGQRLRQPIYGCIGVKKRDGLSEGHQLGHAAFIVGETPAAYLCLGGNQGDTVCIEAIPKDGFFAFRWPPREPIPRPPHPMLVSVPEVHHGLSEA